MNMINFCPNCGTAVSGAGNFCRECGLALRRERVNVSNSQTVFQNRELNYTGTNQAYVKRTGTPLFLENNHSVWNAYRLMEGLAQKVRIEGIIWLVVGIAQIVISIMILSDCSDDTYYLIYALVLIIIAINNFNVARQSFNNAKIFETEPRGIVEAYGNPGEDVASLMYNLIIGAAVGVIGSIYGIIIRKHVKDNALRYREAERIILESKVSERNTFPC
ncbi:MAG: zinc ribbon domain-containing protein [Clostridia bacterium]|nr:zinc ribbon domain-containing protein [Clostridia bacterium]